MVAKQVLVAPGARIEVRDAEWLVRRVEKTETKGQAIHVVGMSELVKGKEVIFLSDAEARTRKNIKVLDPTAIADPENYGPEDIRGLFIRRFKKDIQNQVAGSFQEREIRKIPVPASKEEAFETLASMTFHKLDQHRSGSLLFKTTLEKSLFSSPAACLQTLDNRMATLEKAKGSSPYLKHFSRMWPGLNPQPLPNSTSFLSF